MILVDGVPSAQISARDRGLHYGDGLFETMRLWQGQVPLLEHHLARLEGGSRRLGLTSPDAATWTEDLDRLLAGGPAEGVIRLVLTRGDGGRGYAPPEPAQSRRIVALYAPPAESPGELSVGVCKTRLGHSPALGGLKHLGRLEQVLAAREVAAAGWDEGLMLDESGQLIEATRHNLFYLRDGRLLTPPLENCGVAGIMRALLLEAMARAGVSGGEAQLRYDELHEIEAMFLCNAVAGLRSVKSLAGRACGHSAMTSRLRTLLVEAGVAWLA